MAAIVGLPVPRSFVGNVSPRPPCGYAARPGDVTRGLNSAAPGRRSRHILPEPSDFSFEIASRMASLQEFVEIFMAFREERSRRKLVDPLGNPRYIREHGVCRASVVRTTSRDVRSPTDWSLGTPFLARFGRIFLHVFIGYQQLGIRCQPASDGIGQEARFERRTRPEGPQRVDT